MGWTVVPLGPDTWDGFADLVDRNNGIFGGCWCIGFHLDRADDVPSYREAKRERVHSDRAHAALVVDDDGAVQGWAQFGDVAELPGIKHRRAYEQEPPSVPDWRITCVFVDKRHRGRGVARLAVEGAVDLIA
ncbi:N-acetyltransferase family protein [Knoellia sp. CPCC 206450]|uniref:GNAT family N-acetyltransferase n=1 Tax=Knoellia tibetensis TaxID=3404798 RepID=UPI003B4396EC